MKVIILYDNTFEFTPAMLMRIEEMGVEVEYTHASTLKSAEDADIIFGCPPVETLKTALSLKWHHLPNAAIQPYVSPALYADPGIVLTNSSGVYGEAIGEHIIAMVFALARCFPLYSKQQREHIWERDDYGTRWISGSTVSIFGIGDLGKNAAKRLKALGARTIGVKRTLFDKPPYIDEIYDLRSTDTVLRQSDFVICCLPLTDATRGLFREREFAAMNPQAYFINVGRGAIADTDALTEAIRGGTIAGAALDVTDPEPLPPEHPLWDLYNVIITPHSSCVCHDVQERKLELFLEQLNRYLSGRLLKNVVNFREGY
ncbi:MAG: D-2-hydroxyacid dehydrogenase [Oscillospiraceae bacterium]|nr:D-2-hydroxyacid dehydrogenase [Oscillospiraceae bacterium]